MKSVQERVLGIWPDLEVETTKDLLKAVRKQLLDAYNDGLLKTGFEGIYKWVRWNAEPSADEEILGGEKAFDRDPSRAHLLRTDGAWIHFTIRVRQESRKTLALIAYDFEIVFPLLSDTAGEHKKPNFLRVDLNPPDHPNEAREMRSHLHPSNDDLQWPAPVMTPQEILDLMLHGLRERNPNKPRS